MSVIKGQNLTVGHKGDKIAEKVIKMPIMTFMSFIIAEKVTNMPNYDLFVVHNYWKGHNSHSNYMSKAEETTLLMMKIYIFLTDSYIAF